MKGGRTVLVIAVALLVGLLAVAGIGTALAWGPGPGGQGWGGFGGMMGGYGHGGMMGGGMMGGNYPGGGMMGGRFGQGSVNQGEPISLEQAQRAVQAYVDSTGNNDLVVAELMEFQYNFYAIVEEQSTGIGAFEVLVDKYTGTVFPEHGPNMMWNTKYGMMAGGGHGMMGGMMGGQYGPSWSEPAGEPTVTAEQAEEAGQAWLDRNQPGSTVGHPDEFYGYYTLHTEKDGTVTGMLSVNAYTGQVWYHNWHGDFIQMRELDF
jgi:hypothetical protein